MVSASNMVGPVIFGFFLGYYLDSVFDLSPLLTISLTFLGIATGIWSVIKYTHFQHLTQSPTEIKKESQSSAKDPENLG